jgi:hypothetical protein
MADLMRAAGDAARTGREGACATLAALWAYAESVLEFAVSNPAHWRVMASCRDRAKQEGSHTEAADLAFAAFDELIAAGVLRAEDRDRAILATWAGVYGLAFLLVEGVARNRPDAEDFRHGALDAVLRTTLLGLGVDAALLPPPVPVALTAP